MTASAQQYNKKVSLLSQQTGKKKPKQKPKYKKKKQWLNKILHIMLKEISLKKDLVYTRNLKTKQKK